MAQMLATMGTMEQSRFQAFKRSCFSATAVQDWIAACLQDRFYDSSCNSTTSSSGENQSKRPLADLVATGQATEIGLVVATAAKIYAQRLIGDAIALQRTQQQQQQQQNRQQQEREEGTLGKANPSPTAVTTSSNMDGQTKTPSTTFALATTPTPTTMNWPSSESVWTAVHERMKRGVDPGFFLHPSSTRTAMGSSTMSCGGSSSGTAGLHNWSAKVTTAHHYEARRLVALAAEKAFDQRQQLLQQATPLQYEGNENEKTTNDDNVMMDVVVDTEEIKTEQATKPMDSDEVVDSSGTDSQSKDAAQCGDKEPSG